MVMGRFNLLYNKIGNNFIIELMYLIIMKLYSIE